MKRTLLNSRVHVIMVRILKSRIGLFSIFVNNGTTIIHSLLRREHSVDLCQTSISDKFQWPRHSNPLWQN